MTSIRFMIVLNTVQFNLGFTIYGAYQYDAKMDDADSKLETCDASVCDVIRPSGGGLLI